ncbi:MAG: ferritin [Candidatus Zixiibacteriota bacterium]|nr:MAG: ferritin [candidate division Zixibacteria bacterium]
MMISQAMSDRLNEQVKNEFYSFYLYLAMAYAFEKMNLPIFAKWFFLQADEEREHAMKMAQYILDQGGEVKLAGLPDPKTDYKSAQEIVSDALEHEQLVTRQVGEIADLAIKENDHATRQFIDWFVAEQVEEVKSASELLELVKMADTPGRLLMLEGRLVHMRKGMV